VLAPKKGKKKEGEPKAKEKAKPASPAAPAKDVTEAS
jgi:hypothetical protein